MPQRLSWVLTNPKGVRLAELRDRVPGAEVTIALNGQRTAKLALSLEDEAAAQVRPFDRFLKVFLGEEIIFGGPILVPRWLTAEGILDISAVDVSQRLVQAFTHNFDRQEGVGQADIMHRLILHANRNSGGATGIPLHGIVGGGPFEGNIGRDRSYPDGKQIWEALVDMSNVIGGPDFELRPEDTTTGFNWARFETYHPQQGDDKTDSVRLEAGLGRHTARDFNWEPGGGTIINRYTLAGQATSGTASPAWVAEQPESQKIFGIWEAFDADPDVTRITTLREKAESVVAANAFPIDFFDVTPAPEEGGLIAGTDQRYGVPPKFGPGAAHDYWIGDEISVAARVPPGLDVQLRGRVTDARLVEEDEAGNVAVELTCAPTVSAAGITGFATTASVFDSF